MPLRFLLQGQASPGRGFEELFGAWRSIDPARATLQVRCPPHEYVARLRERFADVAALEWLEPVSEDLLITAARDADVGVIPYVGPSLNHLYASPNKLSQYMSAGLAILSSDLPNIRSLLDRYDCGVVYDPADPTTLVARVEELCGDPDELLRLRTNALHAAATEFNWETVSVPYASALGELAHS